ncbi:MAG TPA: glycerol-3-phosphate 1-O-acyltransferase PlsB, partial [Steroidobacteraceae bacterium]
LVLQYACTALKLPRPRRRVLAQQIKERRACFYLTRPRGFFDTRPDRRPPEPLLNLIDALRADAALDLDLVPVAVYWGRAPQREGSIFRLLLADDWVLTSRLRKLLMVMVNGRNTMVEIGEAISLRSLLEPSASPVGQTRRVARILHGQFRRQRAARIGPDLSHRRTIVARVLRTRAVRAAAESLAREKTLTRRQALLQARTYAEEIAANYSHAFVRFMYRLLGRLWNRLYDGVRMAHAETLRQVAEGNEIVYVPCHRSHMDYLLLSYAIYQQGYAVPHIAAGINLNLPIIGRFLRMGGAFFIRRSFGANTLYTAVFMKYLALIMARGHPIEYFIEGGRSRTGRLLRPKTGMISMTVRSFLRDPLRPVVFVPVYFGYERIAEADTYIGELSGRTKQKESIFGLLRSLRVLRERFGVVHVNIGEPLALASVLDGYAADWRTREFDDATRAPWVGAVVEDIAQQVMRRINGAAAVTPINLLAITLLATPRQTMLETDLARQLELYLGLLRSFPYGERVTVTQLAPAQIIAYGASLRVLTREQHALGDLVRMTGQNAVLATYYRNNILHLFALPSLVACAFLSNSLMRTEDIRRLAARIYPYIATELFLRWSEAELPAVIDQVLQALAGHGLIESVADGTAWRRPPPTAREAMQLSLLAQSTIQTIERYYLAIGLLLKGGSGQLTQHTLEEQCQAAAQRMTMLYGFNSPEFFDRVMFEQFIDLLRERGVIRLAANGQLEYDEVLERVAADAQVVLSEQIRHSILQVA